MYLWFFPDVIHFIDLFEYNLVLKELFIALHSNSWVSVVVFKLWVSIICLFVFVLKNIFDIQIKNQN